ncbi:MAG: hypothetical protein H6Q26_9 [Bacteroidetes bacterium]|nr:hypothetical protein [Bacteroidota bacterium]
MFKVTCLLVVLLVACNHSPVERDRTEKKEVSLDSLSFGSLLTNEADSVYLRTGLYYVSHEKGAVRKRSLYLGSQIFSLSPTPFVSVDNVRDVQIGQAKYDDGTEGPTLILNFDQKGAWDLEHGTGDGIHDSIAVVIVGNVYYAYKNENKYNLGRVEYGFNRFTNEQMLAMKHAVIMKK